MRNQSEGSEKSKVVSNSVMRLPTFVKIILIAIGLVAGISLFPIFNHFKIIAAKQQAPALVTQNHSLYTSSCEIFPANGSGFMFDPSVMRRTDVIYSGVEFVNQHNYPMFMLITSPDGNDRYQAIAVHPNASVTLSLPIDQYGLTILVGRKWCNVDKGFNDGNRVRVTGTFSIRNGETTRVYLQSKGAAAKDFSVSYISEPLQPVSNVEPFQIDGDGSLSLRQTGNGHYFVSGSVNGFPIVYMLDTGASITSISQKTAADAGIQTCTAHTFDTANGVAHGCLAAIREITFGNFRIKNTQVAIMPNMSGALLGMNVLSHIRLEQHGDIMRISANN